ncbi:MAG: hypothetical protein JWM95_1237 [Gemmatimonadetes bacterium]|nr:hypothetical protein [Gemmatimonadota bacterium]
MECVRRVVADGQLAGERIPRPNTVSRIPPAPSNWCGLRKNGVNDRPRAQT